MSLHDIIGKELDLDKYKKALEDEENREENHPVAIESDVWGKVGNTYFPIESTVKELESDFYDVSYSMSYGIVFKKKEFVNDNLLNLPDSESEDMIDHCKQFWGLSDTFKSLGFLHKRGILLYGIQGTGKSVTAFKTGQYVNSVGGITLYPTDPYVAAEGLKALRQIHPDKSVLMVMEDIDSTIMGYGDKKLTALLDGEDKVDNVLYLATTNYPERLPPRLINRPSRFDVVQEMNFPTSAAREMYLQNKAPTLSPEQLKNWVLKTENFTVPMLKELVILVLAYLKPLDESIENVRKISSNRH